MSHHALQRIKVYVPKGVTPEYVKEAIISIMYTQNKISFEEAIEMLSLTRREFEEDILPKYREYGIQSQFAKTVEKLRQETEDKELTDERLTQILNGN